MRRGRGCVQDDVFITCTYCKYIFFLFFYSEFNMIIVKEVNIFYFVSR